MKKTEKEKQDQVSETELNAEREKPEPEKQPERRLESGEIHLTGPPFRRYPRPGH